METLTVMMPRELTAENGAKAAMIGEFSFKVVMTCSACSFDGAQDDCEVCGGNVTYEQSVTVPWGTIKEIYRAAAKHLGCGDEHDEETRSTYCRSPACTQGWALD